MAPKIYIPQSIGIGFVFSGVVSTNIYHNTIRHGTEMCHYFDNKVSIDIIQNCEVYVKQNAYFFPPLFFFWILGFLFTLYATMEK
jgi:hypothetical protein